VLRVLYSAGPGNAFQTFRDWRRGGPDLVNSHVAHSRQMYEALTRHQAAGRITCTYEGDEEQSYGGISVVRRPELSQGKSGLAFYRSLYDKARMNIRDAVEFGADVVIIGEDTIPSHYAPLRRQGVMVVQSLHTRLWREDRAPSLMQRLRHRGYRKGYLHGRTSVISTSDAVSAQVETLAGPGATPIYEFLPLYYPDHYSGLPEPDVSAPRLEILFIGRVEISKGVLDLVEIAEQLKAADVDFRFQICGVGGALDMMKSTVTAHGMDEHFVFHGWCDRDALRAVMAQCHVSIIPTRSDFIEGFNQIVAESVLSGRPTVASSVCPAVNYVGGAVDIVQANDLAGYTAALTELSRDREKLRRRIQACPEASRRFIDTANSFGTALDEVFNAWREKRPIRDHRIPPSLS
jgi:glycogen(starch) synthase